MRGGFNKITFSNDFIIVSGNVIGDVPGTDSLSGILILEDVIRACLKNHFCNLHAPICGIFCLHSVDVARYAALIQTKSPTNCDAHLAESIFRTRSKKVYFIKWVLAAFLL